MLASVDVISAAVSSKTERGQRCSKFMGCDRQEFVSLSYRMFQHCQVARLRAVVHELRIASGLFTGSFKLHLQSFDLGILISETVERLRETATHADRKVRLDFGDPVIGSWDRARLGLALVTVLTNAFDVGTASSIHVTVRTMADLVEITTRCRQSHGDFARNMPRQHHTEDNLEFFVGRQIVLAHGGDIVIKPDEDAVVIRLPRVTTLTAAPGIPEKTGARTWQKKDPEVEHSDRRSLV